MRDRLEEIAAIKAKGFDMSAKPEGINRQETMIKHTGYATPEMNFNKIKIGPQTLDDAIMLVGDLGKANPRCADKATVLRAIANYDLKLMREISEYFYRTSGIYSRILRYMAFMYRYDWYVTPYVYDKKFKAEKIEENFYKCLSDLDAFNVKKKLGEIALKVLLEGAYYGYKVEANGRIVLQELPVNYCRVRFYYGDIPAVEFNMKYFDENFITQEEKNKVLKLFPKEFRKGYDKYKRGLLPPDFQGDDSGWYLLDHKMTVKFNMNDADYPPFISVIPLIIDLDTAQAMDKQKVAQRLLKLVIQKIPLDKNGDLIFDVDEAQQLHNNAVQMIGGALGLKVLTTFADTDVKSLYESGAATAQSDDLERVERQIYNEAGVSQMQFNTSGNLALEKSILNDESTMYNLILQFERFLNGLLEKYNKNKKVQYVCQILTTTIYNYKDLAKMYKDQTQMGYSKMLPQIALGQSQSSILATAKFENDILNLTEMFIPPITSNTMSSDIIAKKMGLPTEDEKKIEGKTSSKESQESSKDIPNPSNNSGSGEVGRKEKPDDEKSAKTIQNRESMT